MDLPKEFLETLRFNAPLSLTSGTFVVTLFLFFIIRSAGLYIYLIFFV